MVYTTCTIAIASEGILSLANNVASAPITGSVQSDNITGEVT